jgi:hypothetical protein
MSLIRLETGTLVVSQTVNERPDMTKKDYELARTVMARDEKEARRPICETTNVRSTRGIAIRERAAA